MEPFLGSFLKPLLSRVELREWVEWLVSQGSSTSAGGGGSGKTGSKRLEEDLLERHPYRGVFVACESMEAAEVEKLFNDVRSAVPTRLLGEG